MPVRPRICAGFRRALVAAIVMTVRRSDIRAMHRCGFGPARWCDARARLCRRGCVRVRVCACLRAYARACLSVVYVRCAHARAGVSVCGCVCAGVCVCGCVCRLPYGTGYCAMLFVAAWHASGADDSEAFAEARQTHGRDTRHAAHGVT